MMSSVLHSLLDVYTHTVCYFGSKSEGHAKLHKMVVYLEFDMPSTTPFCYISKHSHCRYIYNRSF